MTQDKEIIFETISRTTPTFSMEATYRDTDGNVKTLLENKQIIAEPYDFKKHGKRADIQIGKDRTFKLTIRLGNTDDARVADYWTRHPLVFLPGPGGANRNPNCVKPMVKITDKSVEGRVRTSERKLRLTVLNMVNHMDDYSRWNLAAVLGIQNLTEMSDDEIFDKVSTHAETHPLDTLKLMQRNDLEKLIIVKKAIALKVIKDDGTAYKYGETVIGKSGKVDDAIAYCEHNDEHYKAIRREVAFSDLLPLSFKKEHENAGTIAIQGLADLDEVIHNAEVELQKVGDLGIEVPKAGPGRKKEKPVAVS